MTNTNEIRVATESWVNSSIKKEFDPIDINDVYAAFEAGANWQSQQAQGDPVAFARMLGGEVDWDENCLFPDAETGISDLDGRGDSDEYEVVPLYRHPPVLANMPEQGEHTKPVADAVKHLNDWLSMGLCGCEGPGHSCGATKIRNTIEGLEKLLNAPPAPAAVPDSVKNALSFLGKSYYRQWRRDFEAGDRSPGYVCGDINTVLITEIVEWVRSLVNPRSRR